MVKYVLTRILLIKFQGTENIQKQPDRNILKDSFLKILKHLREISMVETVSIKKQVL